MRESEGTVYRSGRGAGMGSMVVLYQGGWVGVFVWASATDPRLRTPATHEASSRPDLIDGCDRSRPKEERKKEGNVDRSMGLLAFHSFMRLDSIDRSKVYEYGVQTARRPARRGRLFLLAFFSTQRQHIRTHPPTPPGPGAATWNRPTPRPRGGCGGGGGGVKFARAHFVVGCRPTSHTTIMALLLLDTGTMKKGEKRRGRARLLRRRAGAGSATWGALLQPFRSLCGCGW